MHPFGKPTGLSLPDLPVPAEPAAYLTERLAGRLVVKWWSNPCGLRPLCVTTAAS